MGAILAGVYYSEMELRITGVFNVLPTENADVRSSIEGIVERIYVTEGAAVKAGDVIARLSARDLLNSRGKTERESREVRGKLAMLEAGASPAEIEVGKAAVSRAEAQLNYVHTRLSRAKMLFEGGVLPRNTLDDIREQSIATESEVAEAKARLNAVLNNVRPEQIDATKAQIEQFEAELRYIDEQIRLLAVVSPATGIVATPGRQLKQMTGQFVRKGDPIAKVYDLQTVTAQMIISEREIADIRVGQSVVLMAGAYPDVSFHGKVTSIATSAQGNSSGGDQALSAANPAGAGAGTRANRTILVTTEIDNRSLALKPEMTGQAKILCGRKPLVDLMTRRLARTFKVEFWSWW